MEKSAPSFMLGGTGPCTARRSAERASLLCRWMLHGAATALRRAAPDQCVVRCYLLLGLLLSAVAAHRLPSRPSVEHQNAHIARSLQLLSETDGFSKIKLSFSEKCPRSLEKCSAVACSVKETSLNGKTGYIDLLSTRESYSRDAAKTSPRVWQDIYELLEKDPFLRKLASGLQFSITTHIAAFYTRAFGSFVSNPLLFQRRLREEHRENFHLLYSVLRTAVASLASNPGEANDDVLGLSNMIIDYNTRAIAERNSLATSRPTIPMLSPNVSEQINIDGITINPETITTINKMIRALACLGCQKCRLWGTIQLRGLRAAVRAINGMPLSRMDVVCLVNAFRRASVSVEESARLQGVRAPVLRLVLVYYYELSLVATSVFCIALFYLKARKQKLS